MPEDAGCALHICSQVTSQPQTCLKHTDCPCKATALCCHLPQQNYCNACQTSILLCQPISRKSASRQDEHHPFPQYRDENITTQQQLHLIEAIGQQDTTMVSRREHTSSRLLVDQTYFLPQPVSSSGTDLPVSVLQRFLNFDLFQNQEYLKVYVRRLISQLGRGLMESEKLLSFQYSTRNEHAQSRNFSVASKCLAKTLNDERLECSESDCTPRKELVLDRHREEPVSIRKFKMDQSRNCSLMNRSRKDMKDSGFPQRLKYSSRSALALRQHSTRNQCRSAISTCLLLITMFFTRGFCEDAELCVVEDPLETPYFTPLLEGAAPCSLCRPLKPSDPPVPSSAAVPSQVIIVDHRGALLPLAPGSPDPSSEVTVVLTGMKPQGYYGLLLHSAGSGHRSFRISVQPTNVEVDMHVVAVSSSPIPVHLPTGRSRVSLTRLNRSLETVEAVASEALAVFGAPSGLYISTQHANLISIDLETTEAGSAKPCSLASLPLVLAPPGGTEGEGVVCRRQSRQPFSGCYQHNLIGAHPYRDDIHIVDVLGSGNSNGSLVLEVHGLPIPLDGQTPSPSPPDSFSFTDDEDPSEPFFNGSSSSDPSKESSTMDEFVSRRFGSGRTRKSFSSSSAMEVETVRRNVTFVLRSVKPVTWLVRPTSVHGTITVLLVGDGQIENGSSAHYGRHAAGVTVVTKTEKMPAPFDQFILSVLSKIGTPISYTNSSSPNKIIVTVPTTNGYHPSARAVQQPQVQHQRDDAVSLVLSQLVVVCSPRAVLIALPAWAADKAASADDGALTLQLNDPDCSSVSNGTHLLLTAEYTRCHFDRVIRGDRTTFVNWVHISLGAVPLSDDEDLAGSGFGPDDGDFEEERRFECDPQQDAGGGQKEPQVVENGEPLYWLELFEAGTSNLTALAAPPPPDSPHLLHKGAVLHATARRRDELNNEQAHVVFEECWFEEDLDHFKSSSNTHPSSNTLSSPGLHVESQDQDSPPSKADLVVADSFKGLSSHDSIVSTSSYSPPSTKTPFEKKISKNLKKSSFDGTSSKSSVDSRGGHPSVTSNKEAGKARRLVLLQKSCSVLPSVIVNQATTSFTLKVGEEFSELTRAMLRCRVGVCSPASLPQPPLNKCIKPSLYCGKAELLRVFKGQPAASLLQTVSLGPFLFGGDSHEGLSMPPILGQPHPVLVMQGVATEIVIVISFVSFAVGVAVTGLLWFLHARICCSRGCKSGLRSLEHPTSAAASCAGAANSGGSTPSSQAPMTGGA